MENASGQMTVVDLSHPEPSARKATATPYPILCVLFILLCAAIASLVIVGRDSPGIAIALAGAIVGAICCVASDRELCNGQGGVVDEDS